MKNLFKIIAAAALAVLLYLAFEAAFSTNERPVTHLVRANEQQLEKQRN